jgi:hypothetical protein
MQSPIGAQKEHQSPKKVQPHQGPPLKRAGGCPPETRRCGRRPRGRNCPRRGHPGRASTRRPRSRGRMLEGWTIKAAAQRAPRSRRGTAQSRLAAGPASTEGPPSSAPAPRSLVIDDGGGWKRAHQRAWVRQRESRRDGMGGGGVGGGGGSCERPKEFKLLKIKKFKK